MELRKTGKELSTHDARSYRHPLDFQAFGPDGHLVDPKQEAKVKALGAALAQQLKRQFC
jgi:hypothetical protein